MSKYNWIIVWHDRHCDDRYKIVLNATMEEAQKIEWTVAKQAGWENEKDAEEYGYGDYGFNEDYFIDLHMLKDDAVVKVGDD